MSRPPLHYQILIALVLAVGVGLSLRAAPIDPAPFAEGFEFAGALFLRLLKMLVVPLIAASIIAGVASVGGTQGFGRLGLKTGGYYLCTTILSVSLGLLLVNVIEPGIVDGSPARDRIGLDAEAAEVSREVAGRTERDLLDVFLRLVPENVFADAAAGEMLGIIFFSLLFGYFTTRIPDAPRATVLGFWQGLYEVMLLITDWVMKFAPIGVFALVAKTVLSTGTAAFRPLAAFFVTVLLGLSLHTFAVLPSLLRLARLSPRRHFRAVAPALLMAFSTASSSATLPLTMNRVEKAAGVSPRVTSFTLPLGATVNMDGTALYECVAAMFIAQAYGLTLGVAEQFTIILMAVLTSVGVAGIPAASLVAITLILTAIGLPIEGVGLILAVDRVLDMCRTAVNVFSDTCGAVIIARTEGETDLHAGA